MRAFRRAVGAMVLAALGGIVLRFKGTKPAPPSSGGWRELSGPELR